MSYLPIEKFSINAWLLEGFIFQKNQDFILGIGPFKTCRYPEQGLYFSPFFGCSAWKRPEKLFLIPRNQLKKLLNKSSVESDSLKLKNPCSFSKYQTQFSQAKQKIHQGEFEKVVPVFYEIFQGKIQVGSWLKKILANQILNTQIYGYWNLKEGFLGCSPETLFSLKNNQIETEALGGTALANSLTLLKDSKELKEHRLIIESIKDSLKKFGTLKTFPTREKKLGHIKHLHTPIRGILQQPFRILDLIEAIHPSAALCGWKKQPSYDWLKQQPRSKYFGSPFGFFDEKKEGQLLVALRGLEWSGNQIFIGSGVGLVAESCLQKEWLELKWKRNQIKQMLQLV